MMISSLACVCSTQMAQKVKCAVMDCAVPCAWRMTMATSTSPKIISSLVLDNVATRIIDDHPDQFEVEINMGPPCSNG